MKNVCYIPLLVLAGCGGGVETDADRIQQPVIYGEDDRVEVLAFDDISLAALARRRVGALIADYSLLPTDDGYEIVGQTLAETGICPEETYAEQLAVAGCTAIRLSPDRIITAGHCFTAGWLTDVVFVSGYWLGSDFPAVAESDVHQIDEVLVHVDGDLEDDPGSDYAVATLREPVPDDGVVLELASRLPEPGEPLVVAGTSEGLALKLDAGGVVTRHLGTRAFELTSDTFVGGSGSAVFTADEKLAGMLIGGGADYELDERRNCLTRRVVSEPPASAEIAVSAAVLDAALERSLHGDDGGCAFSAKAPFRGSTRTSGALMFAWVGLCLRRRMAWRTRAFASSQRSKRSST